MLKVLDSLPPGLLERESSRLHEVLDGPTLIHIDGREPRPLHISVLLHGNEMTGWEAVRRLLTEAAAHPLPRAISLFIGNVAASRDGLRRLDGQPDFNRIWRGHGLEEHRMAARVLDELRVRRVFASIDVHNTTGRNPHYSGVNRLDAETIFLATRFGRRVVYVTNPDSMHSHAFGDLCPSVTVECGVPGHEYGVAHAYQFLETCLHLAAFPDEPLRQHDVDLYHAVAIVKVPRGVEFGFERDNLDLRLEDHIDRLNFHELPAGTPFGSVRARSDAGLEAWNEHGEEVAERYFARRGDQIVTAVPVMPSMLTLDERVIRQDCLCNLMERYSL